MKARRASVSSPHEERLYAWAEKTGLVAAIGEDAARAIISQGGADTVEQFAEKNAISRAQAWKELASGRLVGRKVGARTIITHEDAAKWRRTLPKAPVNGAAKKASDGLPAWLAEPRPSRRRAKSATQGPVGSESDTTK